MRCGPGRVRVAGARLLKEELALLAGGGETQAVFDAACFEVILRQKVEHAAEVARRGELDDAVGVTLELHAAPGHRGCGLVEVGL